MKMLNSKKGSVESVITDVFALLAYFIFFIIVVYLISSTGTKSKADVEVQQAKVDYSLELLNGLRTPIILNDGTTMTFAEYIAEKADEFDKGSTNCFEPQYLSVDDPAALQMVPYFNHLVKKESYPYIVFFYTNEEGIDCFICHPDWFCENSHDWPQVANVSYPSREGRVINAVMRDLRLNP